MSPTSTTSSTSIPKDKHVLVHDGQVVNKGEMIVDGAAEWPASAVIPLTYHPVPDIA